MSILRLFWPQNGLLVGGYLVNSGLQVIAATHLGLATDQLVHRATTGFFQQVGVVLTLWLLSLGLGYFIQVFQEATIQAMATTLRQAVAAGIDHATTQQRQRYTPSEYEALLQGDLTFLENQRFRNAYAMVRFLGNAGFALLALGTYNWTLALLAFTLATLMGVIPRWFHHYTQQGGQLIAAGNHVLMQRVTDAITGYPTLAALSATAYFEGLIHQGSLALKRATVENQRRNARAGTLLAVLNITSQLILIGVTGRLVLKDTLSVGSIVAVSELATKIFDSLGYVNRSLITMGATTPITQKLAAVSHVPAKLTATSTVPRPFVSLVFQDISFRYPESATPVFQHVSFTLTAGNRYLVTGPSGSGKSTLFAPILGTLTPTTGRILLNGHDVTRWPDQRRAASLQSLPQDGYLFRDDVLGNITLGRSRNQLDLPELTRRLKIPTGDPLTFSGGERQRIKLARALLRPDKLTLIDEGFSELDVSAAQAILQVAFTDPQLTLLLISHRQRELAGLTYTVIDLTTFKATTSENN